MKKTILMVALSIGSASASADFAECLIGLQQEARARQLPDHIINEVIPGMQQQSRVLELDRQQPEFTQTFAQYMNARVTEGRIERGRELYRQHRPFLDQLTREYGVPGQYLVAFWGLETNFGSFLGGMPTLDSLATLACDERRAQFFTTEFTNALELMHRESLDPANMRGSWAGAVGHTQFMPSSYLRYAVDGDGDGRIDLWASEQDALASGANFLQQLGWDEGFRWGREVTLPADFPYEKLGASTRLSVTEWAALGVRTATGNPLPAADLQASVLLPAGHRGPAFLIYPNFAVIMRWNRSESYAISVGHLADRIAGAGSLIQMPPTDQPALSRPQVIEIQQALSDRGFDPGGVDGVLGSGTRAALALFQLNNNLVGDGFPDSATIAALLEGRGGI